MYKSVGNERIFEHRVSCTGNRYPIPGDRAPAVTMIGWHGNALGCRRRVGLQAIQAPAPTAK